MEWILVVRWLHIIGSTVLLGTGVGIAFFMVMANRTQDAKIIAHTAATVVIADWLFTATAVIIQPITGSLLVWNIGWSFAEPWIVVALSLYVLVGIFWLPVVAIQVQLRDIARQADSASTPLPARYYRLYRIWFASGFPAFAAVLVIFWLMISKPPGLF